MSISFIKNDSSSYFIIDENNIAGDKIDNIIKELSNDVKYNSIINNTLRETLLSRYYSSLFISEHKENLDKQLYYILIDKNNNYRYSVGCLASDDIYEYLDGVITA